MAFGVEVRLPFLDHNLVEFVFSCPDEDKILKGATKSILREATAGLVPERIRLRTDKLGFHPPEADWMKHPVMQAKTRDAFESLRHRGVIAAKGTMTDAGVGWKVLMADFAFRFAAGEI
jgi:asparagine synthase (glutamine-hydrolysing)